MHHYFEAITNNKGDALSGYYVRLTDSLGNGVSLYADTSLTPIISVSGLADAAKVDANGNVDFYVNIGTYSLNIYATDGTTLIDSIPNVPMNISIDGLYGDAATVSQVASRSILAAITGQGVGASRYLVESGREGTFVWSSGNLSAEVTLDPQQGVYIAPTSDTTGASGAWVRKNPTVTPFHFGAVGDAATNDKTALDALNTWFFNSVRSTWKADFSGDFGYAGTFVLGPSSAASSDVARYNVGGDLRITQLTTGTFETIQAKNLALTVWNGRITAQGYTTDGTHSFASRTCGIGINLINCSMATFTGGLRAYSFWFHGIMLGSQGVGSGTGSNDGNSIGVVRAYFCGSGLSASGYSLTANWSVPVNSGTSGAEGGQATQLTVDTFPNAAIETYVTVGNMPVGVIISNKFYYVSSWNRAGGTISIYPWIDNTSFSAGSGTLRWVFGAGVAMWGSDSNIVSFDHIHAADCGIGIACSSLYGPRVKSANISSNGVGLTLGAGISSAHLGSSFDAFYTESNDIDIILIATRGGNFYNYLPSSYALDLTKCFAMGPRKTDGTIILDALGTGSGASDSPTNGLLISNKGFLHTFHKRSLTNPLTTAMTFREHSRPPRIFTQNVDTQTITFAVMGSGEYNRLFGYNGGTLRYVGSGTNGQPTGSFTFTPPTGGTVNGGSVNASATFSSFYGPVDFECYHTDTAQLTWVVRPVAGYSGNISGALPDDSIGGMHASLNISGGFIDTFPISNLTPIAGVADRIQLYPWTPARDTTISALGVDVSTAVASTNAKVVVYSTDTTTHGPGTLLKETTDLDCSTTGYKNAAWSNTFSKGVQYWVGVRTSGIQTLRANNASASRQIGRTSSTGGGVGATAIQKTLTYATAATSPWGAVTTSDLVAASPYAVIMTLA